MAMSKKLETPKWDEALANMANEEFLKQSRPLNLRDFSELADEYSFRLDDIMVTMFQLVINGDWQYIDNTGTEQQFTQNTLDKLYVNRRLKEEDLQNFNGDWSPR